MNAISTQRGKVVDVPSPSTSQPIRIDDEGIENDEVETTILVPFPHVIKSPKSSKDHGEIIDQLKQVTMNLSLLNVIKKIPSYATVIKNLYTLKRKHKVSKKNQS